jgi:hypothetical protein
MCFPFFWQSTRRRKLKKQHIMLSTDADDYDPDDYDDTNNFLRSTGYYKDQLYTDTDSPNANDDLRISIDSTYETEFVSVLPVVYADCGRPNPPRRQPYRRNSGV